MLIRRCLCSLCSHMVALPVPIEAEGECFAPHLTFRFLEGECHKYDRETEKDEGVMLRIDLKIQMQ